MNIPSLKKLTNIAKDLTQRGLDLIKPKPPEVHGINPKITSAGVETELPRFSSVEMQTARSLNKIAIRQSKSKIQRTFTKASPEDLKRLTSTSIEDTYLRAEWTNPKDGKIYHLLKQRETEDGKVIVRILDSEGAFIKEAELTPKVIAIPDRYDLKGYLGLTHGDIVMTFAKRHNPFATYIPFRIDKTNLNNQTELREIVEYVQKGNKIDYISGSYAGVGLYGRQKSPYQLSDNYRKLTPELFDYNDMTDSGVRVLLGSGNIKPEEYSDLKDLSNRLLICKGQVEGVGSLNPKTGKVSDFSASRNSSLTQHYEVGEFTPTLTKEGVNITGLPGTDLPFPNEKLKQLSQNPLLGKPVEKVKALQTKIEAKIKNLQKEKMALFGKRLPLPELSARIQKIENAIHINMQRKIKLNNLIYELVPNDGKYTVALQELQGTSLSVPTRTAKLALNDMMEGII